VTTFDKFCTKFHALQQTLAQSTSPNYSKLQPGCNNIWHTIYGISSFSANLDTGNFRKLKQTSTCNEEL